MTDTNELEQEPRSGLSDLTVKLERLLPCPFCGSEPEILRKGNDHRPKRSITIRCKGCRVERTDAAIRHSMDWLERVATEQWNERSNVEVRGDASRRPS